MCDEVDKHQVLFYTICCETSKFFVCELSINEVNNQKTILNEHIILNMFMRFLLG